MGKEGAVLIKAIWTAAKALGHHLEPGAHRSPGLRGDGKIPELMRVEQIARWCLFFQSFTNSTNTY